MRRLARWFSSVPPLVVCLFCMSTCTDPETFGLYDPGAVDRPVPSINAISPANSAMAGMDSITVLGQNFSAIAAENSVFFDAEPATILTSTPTQLTLIAPLAVGDSISVRVAVSGALQFSNTLPYALLPGVESFGDLALETNLTPAELASSLTVDAVGNAYVAFVYGTSDGGVLQFTPGGTRTVYAPATPGVVSWSGLKFSAGGNLYAARNFRALYRIAPGGGAAAALWVVMPFGVRIADLDFDQTGILWGGGDNAALYRIQTDKTITTVPFDGNVRSVRVYNDYLYFAADTGDGDKVWRASITPTSLGPPDVYFDFDASYPGLSALAMTFSSDGVLCIGTEPPYGLVVVEASGMSSAPFGAYAGMFGTGVNSLAWGSGADLYAGTVEGDLLKFTVRGKTSAPYYGNSQ